MNYEIQEVRELSADEVKAIRLQNSMTQNELAKFLGVSKKTVEAWEYGDNKVSGPSNRLLLMLSKEGAMVFPFVRKRSESRSENRLDDAVRFYTKGALESRNSLSQWMRYLRKLFFSGKIKDETIVSRLGESDQLTMLQKIVLSSAQDKTTPTHRYVTALNEKAKTPMLDKIRREQC